MPFEDEWALRQGELDAAFGETFTLEPLASPDRPGRPGVPDVNARLIPSIRRPLLPFSGIFVRAGSMIHAEGRGMADRTTHAIAGERPMVDVAKNALLQRPVFGDVIHRLKTGEVFTVQAYLTEDPVRDWIYLAECGQREVALR